MNKIFCQQYLIVNQDKNVTVKIINNNKGVLYKTTLQYVHF